jgi:hypothetical protein
MTIALQPDDALLVIDVQNDFMPNGTLPVAEGDQVVPSSVPSRKSSTTSSLLRIGIPPNTSPSLPRTQAKICLRPSMLPMDRRLSGQNIASRTLPARLFIRHLISRTQNSSYAKASAVISTATPPSLKTTIPPRLVSPDISVSAASNGSSSAALPMTSAFDSPPSTAPPSASSASSSRTLLAL